MDLTSYAAWVYAVIALVAVLPLVPSEALVIAGGVLAAHGRLDVVVLVAAAAAGAFVGDLVTYRTGRAMDSRTFPLLARNPRLIAWTATRLQRGGIGFLVAVRFVPGGRTAGPLSAGFVRFPPRRFVASALAGASLWATCAALLGYLGGEALATPWHGLLVALAVAGLAAFLGGLVPKIQESRHRAGLSPRSTWRHRDPAETARPAPDPSCGRGR